MADSTINARFAEAFISALWAIGRIKGYQENATAALHDVFGPAELEAMFGPADPAGSEEVTGARGPLMTSVFMQALYAASSSTWGGSNEENFYAGELRILGKRVIWQWDWGTVSWYAEGEPGFENAGQLTSSDPF